MGDDEHVPLQCPQCGKAILAVYKPDPRATKEMANRFECPWCHRDAVLYVAGWLSGMVKKRSPRDEGEAGAIQLVVPRLTKAARTRKRQSSGRKAATTKRRKVTSRRTR
jgi:predicted RNA-binding Zn-ribbon protein involved in translation (DUF1610 family)